MLCGTANSVAKLLSNTLTSNSGSRARSMAILRSAAMAAGAAAGIGAAMYADSAFARGGGSMPMRHALGVRPVVSRRGWPVDSTSFTPRQSSPVACATSAWRSMRTLRVVVSSSAR
ncbi:hypothetical protein D3C86_1019200 [compost metagenome]